MPVGKQLAAESNYNVGTSRVRVEQFDVDEASQTINLKACNKIAYQSVPAERELEAS